MPHHNGYGPPGFYYKSRGNWYGPFDTWPHALKNKRDQGLSDHPVYQVWFHDLEDKFWTLPLIPEMRDFASKARIHENDNFMEQLIKLEKDLNGESTTKKFI